MRALTIENAQEIVLGLQDEIRRSADARYDHRLHGVLLVAQGLTCPAVAEMLGDAPRTVENWVRRFEQDGLAGLAEGNRPGRPRRLTDEQLADIDAVLRDSPRSFGLTGALWDGKSLGAFIKSRHGVVLSVRQCQRLFHRLRFRQRKPRPMVAQADPELHASCKKNSRRLRETT